MSGWGRLRLGVTVEGSDRTTIPGNPEEKEPGIHGTWTIFKGSKTNLFDIRYLTGHVKSNDVITQGSTMAHYLSLNCWGVILTPHLIL